MSDATEPCPACRTLTYYVDATGAHKCKTCDGQGVVPAGVTAAYERRRAWLKRRPRPMLPVRR